MKRLPLFLVLAHGLVPILAAAPAVPTELIRESEARQQQLRGDAQRLVEQLDSMLAEYERNGIGGEEMNTVQAVRNTLEKLSAEEMKQVVDLLEKARGLSDPGEAKKQVADAYTSQKAILLQMKKLLAQHLRNQQAQELSAQLAQLADRQAANLQNGITLGQWSGGKKPENFEAALQANLQGQQAEQASIADELKAAAQRIASFGKDAENAEMTARFQKGLETIQKVQPSVDNASEALKNGQLFKAVGDEKVARDAMRKLAKEIAPPQDRAETLRTAQRELAKVIEDQKEIVKNAGKAAGEKDFDQWLDKKIAEKALDGRLAKQTREQLRKNQDLQRQFNEQKDVKANDLAALENNQGDLAGKSDELAQGLAKDVPAAAQDIKAGVDKMQEARGALTDRKPDAATKNAQDALAALQAADSKLQREVAKADAMAGKSGDPVKDLQALQKQTQELAQQQADAAKNPDKAGQAALAQKADDLAKQAANMAQPAAPALQQAAAKAQQAAQAAQAGQPAAAAQAQQAAAQQMAQAAQQMAQQAAAAQQAQQQLAAAQQAQQQLADIIGAEQKLQVETAKGVGLTEPGKPAPRGVFGGQNAKQQEIIEQTETFKKTLTADLAAADAAVGNASKSMGEAKQALDKPDGAPARAAEAKSLEELYAAQKAIQEAAAQAQAALGQDANPPPDANAPQQAAALAQAQAALAKADEAVQQAQKAQEAGQAAQQAAKQAEQAAQQAEQAGNKAAAEQAQQQAKQANQQAAAQQAAAQQAAQQAAAQMAQASEKAGQAAAQGQPMGAAQQAAQAAAQAAAEGAAQAAAQNLPGAQEQSAAAQQAIAQALAAMAQAQAGLTASNTPGMPGPPSGQPGPPSGKPGPKPGQKPGKDPGKTPGMPGTEAAEKYQPAGSEVAQAGSRTVASKKGMFTALPARERAVIEQAQAERYPEEYGAQVEQYLLNLARESAQKK